MTTLVLLEQELTAPAELQQMLYNYFIDFKIIQQPDPVQRIILSTAEGLHIVPFIELIRLESDGNYTTFFTTQERILVTTCLGAFEHLTESGPFFRTHQSHIVNLHFVRKVLREDGGCVVLQDGSRVPIARRRKEAFVKLLTS